MNDITRTSKERCSHLNLHRKAGHAYHCMDCLELFCVQSHTPEPEDELRDALRGLLEIEDARIATGAFKPNVEGQRRIDAARSALTKEV